MSKTKFQAFRVVEHVQEFYLRRFPCWVSAWDSDILEYLLNRWRLRKCAHVEQLEEIVERIVKRSNLFHSRRVPIWRDEIEMIMRGCGIRVPEYQVRCFEVSSEVVELPVNRVIVESVSA